MSNTKKGQAPDLKPQFPSLATIQQELGKAQSVDDFFLSGLDERARRKPGKVGNDAGIRSSACGGCGDGERLGT
jgi:hypothetical protein